MDHFTCDRCRECHGNTNKPKIVNPTVNEVIISELIIGLLLCLIFAR